MDRPARPWRPRTSPRHSVQPLPDTFRVAVFLAFSFARLGQPPRVIRAEAVFILEPIAAFLFRGWPCLLDERDPLVEIAARLLLETGQCVLRRGNARMDAIGRLGPRSSSI